MTRPIGVATLNSYLKREITSNPILQNISVVGEVVNLKKSIYIYFDLKEDEDTLSCVFFNNRIDFQNGDKLQVNGNISLYGKGSKVQMIVKSFEKQGIGKFSENMTELKARLKEKGYFDPSQKKDLSDLPYNIGLVTSENSAAIHDFYRVMNDLKYNCKIFFHNAQVQGVNSPKSLVKAIEALDELGLDLIVITRGGGSNEDLSSFNDEGLADAIYRAKTPILTAIGHEIDLSIADLVADKYQSTPTKAAEYIAKKYIETVMNTESFKSIIDRNMKSLISSKTLALEEINRQIEKVSPAIRLNQLESSLMKLETNNDLTLKDKIYHYLEDLNNLSLEIDTHFKNINDKNSFYIKTLDKKYLTPSDLVEHSKYILENPDGNFLIELLEKING